MKIKSTITSFSIAFALAMVSLSSASVQAAYVEGGNIYRVKNITKNSDYSDPATADKCDELQYRVRIHNPGPDNAITNVTVQVGFQSAASTTNVSTIVVRSDNANPSNTSDTATVNISTAEKIAYVVGSSELLDANGNFLSKISDVTAGSGAAIGSVGVSVNEKRFVQFKAKVNCPQPAPTKPVAVAAPKALPATGPADVVAAVATVMLVSSSAHYLIRRSSNA